MSGSIDWLGWVEFIGGSDLLEIDVSYTSGSVDVSDCIYISEEDVAKIISDRVSKDCDGSKILIHSIKVDVL